MVSAGRALVERTKNAAPATVPLVGAAAPIPVSEHFHLFLVSDGGDDAEVPARLHGTCCVVDARSAGGNAPGFPGLQAHALWDVAAPAELPGVFSNLQRLAPKRAAAARQAAAKEDQLFCALLACQATDDDDGVGGDDSEAGSRAARKEMATALDKISSAKPEQRHDALRAAHLWKLAATTGIAGRVAFYGRPVSGRPGFGRPVSGRPGFGRPVSDDPAPRNIRVLAAASPRPVSAERRRRRDPSPRNAGASSQVRGARASRRGSSTTPICWNPSRRRRRTSRASAGPSPSSRRRIWSSGKRSSR